MKEHSEYLYEFDINGYVILPSVLRDNEIQNFLDYWSSNLFEHPVHDVNFNWGAEWCRLIDCEPVFAFLCAVFNSRFRLDHMFCVDERFVSAGAKLHHGPNMFEEGIYYFVRDKKIHCGLVAAQYSLIDAPLQANHFCCIPGSHRGNFPVPEHLRTLKDNALARHIALRAGDALIFSEALVHGTCKVESSGPRRAVFARYMNAYSYFRRPPQHDLINILPRTPNHAQSNNNHFDPRCLSPRQRQIVVEPAYARGRPALKE